MYGAEIACRFSPDMYVDEKIILKEILRKQDGRAGFFLTRCGWYKLQGI
jgi:hypothetical protein